MKIVKFQGGLGNQMFQYAFLLALKKASNEDVYIDISEYSRHKQHNGYELKRVFGICNEIASIHDIWKYTCIFRNDIINRIYIKISRFRKSDIKEINSYKYLPGILTEHRDGYYDGYWQCFKYFDCCSDDIIRYFTFVPATDSQNCDIIERINNDNKSVSLHIRRGDYLKSDIYRGLCGIEYYTKAILYVRSLLGDGIFFYIFSDDIQWCRENILCLLNKDKFIFVDWNSESQSFRDMQLMSLCRANIIANSSFSWWAAYLNKRNDKIVIAPEKWVNLPLEYRMQLPCWKTF